MAFGANPVSTAMIEGEIMAETGAFPGRGVVAVRALPLEVIRGPGAGMAGDAVSSPGMIEIRRSPAAAGMAV